MKYFSLIGLFLTSILILNGCSKKILSSKTYEKNGVLLEYYVDKPVTGLVKDGDDLKSYKDGILDGESTIFGSDLFRSNNSKAILNYKNGILNGKAKYYYKGDLTCECNYKDGLLDGLLTNFSEGKKSFEGTFQEGKAVGGKFIVRDSEENILSQFDIDPTMEIKKVKYYDPSSIDNLNLRIKNLHGWEEFYYMSDPIITPIKIMMNESKYNFSDIIKNSPQMIAKDEGGMYVNNFLKADHSENNHVSLQQAWFYLNDEFRPIEYIHDCKDKEEIKKIRNDIDKLLSDNSYSIIGKPIITQEQYKNDSGFSCPLIITTTDWENKSNGSDNFIKVREIKFDTEVRLMMGTQFEIRHLRITK